VIVEIADELFASEHADDALLLWILRQGMQGRFAVKTRPAFRLNADRPANRWIERQSENAAETARKGFIRGVAWKSRAWPAGRAEPHVVLEVREQPSWPRSFDDGPARLALNTDAEDLLNRPLALKLENEIGDWHFLKKVVPPLWHKRWRQAEKRRWLEQEQGGGVSEIRRVLEQAVAGDVCRRLRTWVMFDNDGTEPGAISDEAERTRATCERIGVPFHMLERRMNENYLPERAMRAWAGEVVATAKRTSNKPKLHADAATLDKKIDEYWALAAEDRHVTSLKGHDKTAKKFDLPPLAAIWGGDDAITERELIDDGWGSERDALFLSLFASL